MNESAEILVCKFNWVERFPIIESLSTPGADVSVAARPREDGGCMSVMWRRGHADGSATVALGLPLASIGGMPRTFALECACDVSDVVAEVEMGGGDGADLRYRFVLPERDRWTRCTVEVQSPADHVKPASAAPGDVVGPLQLRRLDLLFPADCQAAEYRLAYLTAIGPCHLVPSGLA